MHSKIASKRESFKSQIFANGEKKEERNVAGKRGIGASQTHMPIIQLLENVHDWNHIKINGPPKQRSLKITHKYMLILFHIAFSTRFFF